MLNFLRLRRVIQIAFLVVFFYLMARTAGLAELSLARVHANPFFITDPLLALAAMITARYSSGKNDPSVMVEAQVNGETHKINIAPARNEDLEPVILR